MFENENVEMPRLFYVYVYIQIKISSQTLFYNKFVWKHISNFPLPFHFAWFALTLTIYFNVLNNQISNQNEQ